MIKSLLIANRGEICCRIIKSAKLLGIKCLGVYSEQDRNSLHVKECDESFLIGPSPAQQSYLCQDKLISLATENHVDAIHPGYGFLSENFSFSEKCEKNGIIFVGPTHKAIHDMGVKSISKRLMQKVGVPIIPGYFGENQSDSILLQEAKTIGFPVLLKADYGGGGKGIRICMSEQEFQSNLDSVRNEAQKAFGNEKIMVEKFIQEPKHIEIQVFGDNFGNLVTLFERDCSIQRRHQKILEESPASFLPPDKRNQLYEYALQAARAVNYCGAGTVEFMIDKSGKFYFMEMNTRLQVEHGITEMITGLDLVEWQLRVASGQKLPLSQSQIKSDGHAIELRICAEDPDQDFMPSPGPLNRFVFDRDELDKNVRMDSGVVQGDEISIYYDSMIAKLMVWGINRPVALLKLKKALNSLYISGVKNNIAFLNSLLAHPHINYEQKLNTDFIKLESRVLKQTLGSISKEGLGEILAQASMAHILSNDSSVINGKEHRCDPFSTYKWFRLNTNYKKDMNLQHSGSEYKVRITFLKDNTYLIKVGDIFDKVIKVDDQILYTKSVSELNWSDGPNNQLIKFIKDDDIVILNSKGIQHEIRILQTDDRFVSDKNESNIRGLNYVAPITGTIDKILVKVGDTIKSNQPLIIILAMKMEVNIQNSLISKESRIE
ncbi:unnamed protein product [Gordionus sp. m RMFG-2023]